MKQLKLSFAKKVTFKRGDRVVHRLTGQKMTIKHVSEFFATCIKDIPEPWMFWGITYPGDIAICAIENLEHL